MALVLADRVQETTTTTGTGTVTLAGAVSGFQSFSVVGNGNTTFYTIVDSTAGTWEVGLGTYTSSGTTLARTTVLASSNSGSLVNFGAGTKQVFVTYPASQYGNVVGPASASDSRIALYDGTTGRLLKNFTTGVAYLSSGSEAYVTAIGQITAKYAFTLDSADTAGWTLNSATAGNSVTFKPPSSGGNNTYIWPAGPGSSGYALTTNGTGTLSWTAVGGGGGASTILESKQTISSNYTLTAGYNGISVGPVTISSGVSVTIPSGAKWLVVNSSPGATPVSSGGGIMPAMIWG
jgi:hypothetical protein